MGAEVAVTFRVACPDGSVRHSGVFREYGRAAHWALQDACCPGRDHEVVPVLTSRAHQHTKGTRP